MHIARMNDDRKPKIGEMTETDYELVFFWRSFLFFRSEKRVHELHINVLSTCRLKTKAQVGM